MNFKFDYWYTTVGFVGGSRTGKSYATKSLISRAKGRSYILVAYADQKQEFAGLSKNITVANYKDWNGQTIDRFIEINNGEADKSKQVSLLVFDDLDTFIKSHNDSRYLDNVPIASKGHWRQGCVWQSRRVKCLPKKLIQNSDYLVFTHNIDPYDYDDLEQFAGLDIELYKSLPPPVKSPADPKKLLNASYLILNKETREQVIISGFA